MKLEFNSCGCTCGGVKNIIDHHHMEYVMSFLTGLWWIFLPSSGSDHHYGSYAFHQSCLFFGYTRGTIMPIYFTAAYAVKTGSFRWGGYDSTKSSNLNVFRNQRKDCLYCTHCKLTGHVVDRCYKLHGYPPSYKSRDNHTLAVVHQISILNSNSDCPTGGHQLRSMETFVNNLSSTQYHQLMSMLSTHLDASTQPLHPLMILMWVYIFLQPWLQLSKLVNIGLLTQVQPDTSVLKLVFSHHFTLFPTRQCTYLTIPRFWFILLEISSYIQILFSRTFCPLLNSIWTYCQLVPC